MAIKFRIRPAKLKDCNGIKMVNEKCLTVTYTDDFWKENYKNIFVLLANIDIIGYIMIDEEQTIKAIKNCGVVYTFAIIEEFRGKGLGKKLLLVGMEELKDRGMKAIVLRVLTDNISAQKLYEKCGFKIIKTLTNYYTFEDGTNNDAFLMSCIL